MLTVYFECNVCHACNVSGGDDSSSLVLDLYFYLVLVRVSRVLMCSCPFPSRFSLLFLFSVLHSLLASSCFLYFWVPLVLLSFLLSVPISCFYSLLVLVISCVTTCIRKVSHHFILLWWRKQISFFFISLSWVELSCWWFSSSLDRTFLWVFIRWLWPCTFLISIARAILYPFPLILFFLERR